VRQSSPGGDMGGERVPIVGSSCAATPSENIKDLARAIVKRKAC
jgi:hypothetical protein